MCAGGLGLRVKGLDANLEAEDEGSRLEDAENFCVDGEGVNGELGR